MQWLRSTTFHPHTDGQTEIVNKVVETYLRCFANKTPKKWAKWLHWAKFSYNTAAHLLTKMSPFQALYGCVPPHVVRMGHQQTPVDSLDQFLQEKDVTLEELQSNIMKAQQRMKYYAEKKKGMSPMKWGSWYILKHDLTSRRP